MKTMRYADHVANYMRRKTMKSIGWLDGGLLDAVPEEVFRESRNPHPLNRMRAVAYSMDKAGDLFERTKRLSIDSRGHERIVRMWLLK